MVNFGIESGSEEVLRLIHKNISIPKAIEAVRSCRQAGLRTQCTFIMGFPFDSKQTMRMTLEAAKKISPTLALFFPLVPYPGTEIYKNLYAQDPGPGLSDWGKFTMTSFRGGLSPNPAYTARQLSRLVNLWHLKFYLRPAQIAAILRTICSPHDLVNMFRCFFYFLRKQVLEFI
jgi:hypothetical protein